MHNISEYQPNLVRMGLLTSKKVLHKFFAIQLLVLTKFSRALISPVAKSSNDKKGGVPKAITTITINLKSPHLKKHGLARSITEDDIGPHN